MNKYVLRLIMSEYIFYTTEGFTQAPNGNDVENCQVLGRAFGKNIKEARCNLLKENPWIEEAEFDMEDLLVKQLFLSVFYHKPTHFSIAVQKNFDTVRFFVQKNVKDKNCVKIKRATHAALSVWHIIA